MRITICMCYWLPISLQKRKLEKKLISVISARSKILSDRLSSQCWRGKSKKQYHTQHRRKSFPPQRPKSPRVQQNWSAVGLQTKGKKHWTRSGPHPPLSTTARIRPPCRSNYSADTETGHTLGNELIGSG